MLGGGVGRRLRERTRPGRAARAVPLPGGARRWSAAAGAVLVLAAMAGLAWWLWPGREPDPRARQYTDRTACLLTGAAGVTAPEAAPVWAGMQEASLQTLAKVQYLEVDGPQTRDNAATFLATLATSDCDLVITVGAAPNAALSVSASAYPDIQFVAVGAFSGGFNGAGVTVVPEGNAEVVRTAVRQAVMAAVKD